jgi:hypothetical protein
VVRIEVPDLWPGGLGRSRHSLAGMARRGTIALLAVAAACLLAAAVGAYARYAVLDEQAFADRAVRTLESDEVQREAAARMADQAVAQHPQLAVGEAAIEDAIVIGVIEDPTFAPAFHAAAAGMHRGIFDDADAPAALTIPGSGAALRAELVDRLPFLAPRIPRIADAPVLAVRDTGPEGVLRTMAPPAAALAGPATAALGLAGVLFLLVALVVARDRRHAVWAAGLAVAAAGGLVAAGVTGAHDLLMEQFDTRYGDAVVTAVWNAFMADLRLWGLVACGIGLVAAAATGHPRPALRRSPSQPLGRAGRAVALLAVAAVALQLPLLVLHVAVVALAAAAVYVAAGDLLTPWRAPGRRGSRAAGTSPVGSSTAPLRSPSPPRRTW